MTKKLPLELKETRRPIHTACGFCHEKHLQCDVGRPCQNCTKRNIGSLCKDKIRKRRKRSPPVGEIFPSSPELFSGVSLTHNGETNWTASGVLESEENDDDILKELEVNSKSSKDPENRTKLIEGISDALGEDFNDLQGNNQPIEWEFGSNWANDEYMKLKDLTGLVSEDAKDSFLEPISVDDQLPQYSIDGQPEQSNSSHMLRYLSLGSTWHRTNSRPYISLETTQTNQNITYDDKLSFTEEMSANQQQQEQELELTPFKLRQLIKTPQDLFENRELIKPHNYRKAYRELLRCLHRMFLQNYYSLQNGKWVPHSNDEDQKRQQWIRREQLQHIAKSIGERYMPMFVALTSNMIEEDLLLQEITLQRTLLEFEDMSKFVNCTPLCIWRRSGEICFVSHEFCSLTGFHKKDLLDKRRFIVEFMDHQSVLNYYDLFHDHLAFGSKKGGEISSTNDQAVYTECNMLLKSGSYLKCACCLTARRDNFNISLLLVGQFLPIFDFQ